MDAAKDFAAALSGGTCPACGECWRIVRMLHEDQEACQTCAELHRAEYGEAAISSIRIVRSERR